MTRLSWDDYFMTIARQVAKRSTCPRRSVGAVIVREKRILCTGYNGSIRGLPHCDEVGCLMEEGHCVATIHAEANAILQAAIHGIAIEKAEIYSTSKPCWNCFKLIANAGIGRIVYADPYPEERIDRYAEMTGITLLHLPQHGTSGTP